MESSPDILISAVGDPTVGIPDDHITISGMSGLDGEYFRNKVRLELELTFSALLDNKVRVQFGDECPVCGEVMSTEDIEADRCPREACVYNVRGE